MFRVTYDAFRVELESTPQQSPKYQELQQSFEKHRIEFERLRQAVDIKLKLLDENKVISNTGVLSRGIRS